VVKGMVMAVWILMTSFKCFSVVVVVAEVADLTPSTSDLSFVFNYYT
jgi:hypothetical protein